MTDHLTFHLLQKPVPERHAEVFLASMVSDAEVQQSGEGGCVRTACRTSLRSLLRAVNARFPVLFTVPLLLQSLQDTLTPAPLPVPSAAGDTGGPAHSVSAWRPQEQKAADCKSHLLKGKAPPSQPPCCQRPCGQTILRQQCFPNQDREKHQNRVVRCQLTTKL